MATAPDAQKRGSVLRQTDFRLLFTGAVVSQVGTQLNILAIPVFAVVHLDVGVGQVGLLAMLSTAAFLVVGLPAGAWVDRARKRPMMIRADFARAALLVSVPIAWWAESLTIYHLYVVVFLLGVATVFFDIAAMSYVPAVVGRDRLTEANSLLGGMTATSEIAGKGVGGLLIQAVTAPAALILVVLSFLWSAAWMLRIDHTETTPPHPRRTGLFRETWEGVRYVMREPILRPLALEGALFNLALQMCLTALTVLFLKDLGLSSGLLGVYLAVGGVGTLLGALTAKAIESRVGIGPALLLMGLCTVPAAALIPLVQDGWLLWGTGFAWLAMMWRCGSTNVLKISFRQFVTPDRLLGRMNATFRFLLTGALAVGAGLGGLLGELLGLRSTLWIGAAILGLSWTIMLVSPIRTMRQLPDTEVATQLQQSADGPRRPQTDVAASPE